MPKPPKAIHTAEAKSRHGPTAAKPRFYEILCMLNQGFEQVLGQLRQLERLGHGHQPWKTLRVIVEENRAEINFEVVELLQERELKDWTYFGRLREEHEKEASRPGSKNHRNRNQGPHKEK